MLFIVFALQDKAKRISKITKTARQNSCPHACIDVVHFFYDLRLFWKVGNSKVKNLGIQNPLIIHQPGLPAKGVLATFGHQVKLYIWAVLGSKMVRKHFFPKVILDHLWCTILSPSSPFYGLTSVQNGHFATKNCPEKWAQNMFFQNDVGPFGVLKWNNSVHLSLFRPHISPFRHMYASSYALRTHLRAVLRGHLALG